MISIIVDDSEILAKLNYLLIKTGNLKPLMQDLGEFLSETTKRRFDTSTAPDGSRWEPNSEVTILQYLGVYKGSYKKKGGLSKLDEKRKAGKRPLIGETKTLYKTIAYRADNDSVVIGSPMIYAAAQQFGMKKGDAGLNKRGSPIPWGDIPARPFLGVSAGDRSAILDLISEYLDPVP